jgi:hypothetical protein
MPDDQTEELDELDELDTDGVEDLDPMPEGSVGVVTDWVGDDPARAQAAIDVEEAAAKPRKGLIAALRAILATDGQADDAEPAHESNGTLDEPDDLTPEAFDPQNPTAGQFVAVGVEHVARDGVEWTVDPETGLTLAEV